MSLFDIYNAPGSRSRHGRHTLLTDNYFLCRCSPASAPFGLGNQSACLSWPCTVPYGTVLLLGSLVLGLEVKSEKRRRRLHVEKWRRDGPVSDTSIQLESDVVATLFG